MMELNDIICLICLRTDRKLKAAPAVLSKYHNEMTNRYITTKIFNYCNFCEHLLRKAYKFHQKCLTAAKILKSWENSTASIKTPIHQLHLELIPETLGPWIASNNKIQCLLDSSDGNSLNVRNSLSAPVKVPMLEIPLLMTPALDIRKEVEYAFEEVNIVTNVDPQDNIVNKEVKKINYTPDRHSIKIINADKENNNKLQKTETNSNFKTPRRIKLHRNLQVEEGKLEYPTINISDDDSNDNVIDEVKEPDDISVNNDHDYIANNHTIVTPNNNNTKTKMDKSELALKLMYTLKTLNEKMEDICQNWDIPALTHMAEDITTEKVRKITRQYLANKKVTVSRIEENNITQKMEAMDVDLYSIISECKVQVTDAINADVTRREWLILTLAKHMRAWGEIYLEKEKKFDTESIINCLDKVSQKNIKQLYYYFSDTNNSRVLPVEITRILKNTETKLKDEEYASVFEIQYLTTEKAKIEEFQQRKTYGCYLEASVRCEKCFVKCKNSGLLELHNKTHHDESNTKHICNICPVRRSSKDRLKHHMTMHDEVFKCKLCPLVTYYRESMIQHYLLHIGKSEHTCEKCNKTFRSLSAFLTHNSQYHPRGAHICGICGGSYISRLGLKSHITRKHPGAKNDAMSSELKCGTCNITFSSLDEYSEHSRNYHRTFSRNVLNVKCEYCSLSFRTIAERTKHLMSAHGIKNVVQVKCEYCSLSFRTMAERTQHLMSAHGIKKKKPIVRCRVCGEVGHSVGWVMQHYITHHPTVDVPSLYADKKTQLCEVCGKGFSNICYLREHMNIHEGITFPCPRCPKRFGNKAALKRHERIHNPPGFTCKYCGKKFNSPPNLSNHLRTHIGDRRYKCDICGKGFLHRATLREHIRGVHNNQRRIRKPKLATRRTRDIKHETETVDEVREAIDEVTEAIDEVTEATDEVRETIDEGIDATEEYLESTDDEIAETMEEIEVIHEETVVIDEEEIQYEVLETDTAMIDDETTYEVIDGEMRDEFLEFTEVEVDSELYNDMVEIEDEIIL